MREVYTFVIRDKQWVENLNLGWEKVVEGQRASFPEGVRLMRI